MGGGGAGIRGDSVIGSHGFFGATDHDVRAFLEPTANLALSKDAVHVWRAALDVPETQIGVLRETLDEDELRRAERFRFPEHRRHFIVARGILRRLLARYLNEPADRIGFEYNRYGKPFLKEQGSSLIRFNLSHSGGMALYVFSRIREVGIDIEWTRRRMGDAEQIATRFFSPREAKVLLGIPEHLRKEAFFGCWTRKEAYIKARGKGLSIPLDRFEVIPLSEETIPPNGSTNASDRDNLSILTDPFTLRTNDGPRQTTWGMRTFKVGHEHIAAVVVEGEEWRMQCWQWRGI